MKIFDFLLSINPNYILAGLIFSFFTLEMIFNKPKRLGGKLNHFFHKVHHEQDQKYTDSNYGTVLIIWDRLFKTFRTKPVKDIKYGLIEFEGAEKQSFLYQIRSPFITMNPKS